jgi:hypothetical protein
MHWGKGNRGCTGGGTVNRLQEVSTDEEKERFQNSWFDPVDAALR